MQMFTGPMEYLAEKTGIMQKCIQASIVINNQLLSVIEFEML